MAETGTQSPGDAPRSGVTVNWAAALAEHERWLRAVIYARVNDPHAVDEVFQEVSLAAVRQTAPLQDASKVAPWLYRLSVLQALLYRRKRRRVRDREERAAAEYRATSDEGRSGDPLAWLLADERKRLVREALRRLPARDSEILLLKYSEGWNYHQIAERMGISHSAVESRLHRARARLRTELEAVHGVETVV
jgi:RNA polymerase sigma-70 factor (ECF subfamily)